MISTPLWSSPSFAWRLRWLARRAAPSAFPTCTGNRPSQCRSYGLHSCDGADARSRCGLEWASARKPRAPSQEPSKRFGVWDPHENPGHRPNDRNPVTTVLSEPDNVGHAKKKNQVWKAGERLLTRPASLREMHDT